MHDIEHLELTREILKEKYPEYVEAFDKVMKRTSGHMFNMCIMKRDVLNSYCTWLFDILFTLEKEIEALEQEKADIEAALSSGTISTQEIIDMSKRLPVVNDLLDEKSTRWLELSFL